MDLVGKCGVWKIMDSMCSAVNVSSFNQVDGRLSVIKCPILCKGKQENVSVWNSLYSLMEELVTRQVVYKYFCSFHCPLFGLEGCV